MTAWLRVRVDQGMFSDELAVTYPPDEGRYRRCVFVPISDVRQQSEHSGDVRVDVVEREGVRYAVLPSPERDIVRVEEGDLRRQ
jgi:hypothetical protein